MAEKVKDVMTPDPTTLDTGAILIDAAKAMRDGDFGAVIVTESDQATGIVTDRDIVVRAIADGRDPSETTVGDVASRELTVLAPDDDLREAIEQMRQDDIRRLPVVEGGQPVGILSLGDLAVERDPDSVLADISSAPADD